MRRTGASEPSTWAAPLAACGEGTRLWVVDLSTSDRMRWLVRWAAVCSMRWARATTRSQGSFCAVVHAPGTRATEGKWPPGVDVMRPPDVLTGAELRDVHEWVHRVSLDVVHGAPAALFPAVLGVHLGQLNLLAVQSYLAHYRLLWTTIEALLGRVPVGRCHIFSGDRALANVLHQRAASRIPRVSSWSPDLFRRLVRSPARAVRRFVARYGRLGDPDLPQAARKMVREHGLRDDLKGRILLVSESAPIAETFRTVEARLQEAGLGPVITVDLGGDPRKPLGQSTRTRICLGAYDRGAELGSASARWSGLNGNRSGCRQAAVGSEGELTELARGVLAKLVDGNAFDRQAGHLYVVEAVLDVLRPELVVVGNDRWWVGQAFVQLARLRGIPSLCVQDGVAADEPTWWWATADRVAASGEMLARLLVEHGASPSRVVVTGQPRYDDLGSHHAPGARQSSREGLGLDPGAFTVLFATQEGQDPEYVRAVVAAILAVPDVRLLLRPHPAEPHVLHSRLVKADRSGRTSLHRYENIYDLVRAADVLVTQHSTVAVEASLLGTVVALADFSGTEAAVPYLRLGIGTMAHSPQELTEALRRQVSARPDGVARDNGRGAHALSELAGPLDGGAGERVAGAIAGMLQGPGAGAARPPVGSLAGARTSGGNPMGAGEEGE